MVALHAHGGDVPAQGFHRGFQTNATLLHPWRRATSPRFPLQPYEGGLMYANCEPSESW